MYSKINVKLSRIHACVENQYLLYLNAQKKWENHVTLDFHSPWSMNPLAHSHPVSELSELKQIPGSELTLGF